MMKKSKQRHKWSLVSDFEAAKKFLFSKKAFLGGTYGEYALITIVFAVLTLFYTDFALLHGAHQLFVEGPGDGTAGILWSNTIEPSLTPWNVHTDMINYPLGQNLASRSAVTSMTLIGPLFILSKLFGAMMSLNLVTFWGFLGCALTMYWLVKRLTGSIAAAFFAGFAATFTPYHLVKSSSHLAYGFSLNFTLILAAFIALWRKQSLRRSVLLAATIGLAYYTDGYFLLLATVFVAALILAGLLHDVVFREPWLQKVKYIGFMLLALLVFTTPIALTQIKYGQEIRGHLSGVRDSIVHEMDNFSTIPADYLVPPALNPWLGKLSLLQPVEKYKDARSNQSENATYIGYVVIGLCLFGLIKALPVLRCRKKAVSDGYKTFVGVLVLVVAPILMLCSFRPMVHVLGHEVLMPSGLLVAAHIDLWRVLARFYLPLHILLVVFAAFGLASIINLAKIHTKRNNKKLSLAWAITLFLVGLVAFEYATTVNRPAYDFKRLPTVYTWLSEQKDIQVIAELPITDRPPETSYPYATAQVIHGKKLVNDHTGNIVVGTQTMLGNIDNPESIDYAIRRGAQLIISHGVECQRYDWGSLVYKDQNLLKSKETAAYGQPICVYKVSASASQIDNRFAVMRAGTNGGLESRGIYGVWRSVDGQMSMSVADEFGKPTSGKLSLRGSFALTTQADQKKWIVSQNGQRLGEGSMSDAMEIVIDASQPVQFSCQDANGTCQDPFLLSHEIVTAE